MSPAPVLPPLPTWEAIRYLVPLKEGGSLPAVVETEGGGLFVVKFRGAGQGAKALIAELIVARLAAALELPVPEVALIELTHDFGRTEPDPEIQDILKGSRGLNFGIRYLDGALNFDPGAAGDLVAEDFASRLVWLDALVTNPDRTHKNPNLLVHGETLWLIDHGAALYAHHQWSAVDDARMRTPFSPIAQHVLLERAGALAAVDEALTARITPTLLEEALAAVPDALLLDEVGGADFPDAPTARARYVHYLSTRLEAPRAWVGEAQGARERLRTTPPRPLRARR
ncbi:MAG: HipA family kinase [Gemmatimonadota bacterium]